MSTSSEERRWRTSWRVCQHFFCSNSLFPARSRFLCLFLEEILIHGHLFAIGHAVQEERLSLHGALERLELGATPFEMVDFGHDLGDFRLAVD